MTVEPPVRYSRDDDQRMCRDSLIESFARFPISTIEAHRSLKGDQFTETVIIKRNFPGNSKGHSKPDPAQEEDTIRLLPGLDTVRCLKRVGQRFDTLESNEKDRQRNLTCMNCVAGLSPTSSAFVSISKSETADKRSDIISHGAESSDA